MELLGRHVSSRSLIACGAVALAAAVGVVGLGIAPWLIVMGAFCLVMMGSMLWMMVGMGRNATHRR
jgi:fatty acid desaturase